MERKRTFWIGFAAAVLFAVAVQGALAGEMPSGKVDPKAAFDQLKGLAGDWNGTAGQGMPSPVSYKVSANGNAVMETLFPATDHEMISMYYLADGNLMATHYCSVGNQPHFKLDREKSTPTELVFAFDGGTNFDPSKDGHVHEGKIRFAGDGKLENSWTLFVGGKPAEKLEFHLARVTAK